MESSEVLVSVETRNRQKRSLLIRPTNICKVSVGPVSFIPHLSFLFPLHPTSARARTNHRVNLIHSTVFLIVLCHSSLTIPASVSSISIRKENEHSIYHICMYHTATWSYNYLKVFTFYIIKKNAYAAQSAIKTFAWGFRFDHVVIKLFDTSWVEGTDDEEPLSVWPLSERVWPWPENAPDDADLPNWVMADLRAL
jgi:hypothetical protein